MSEPDDRNYGPEPEHPNCKMAFTPADEDGFPIISPELLDRNALRKHARTGGVELTNVPDDRLDGLLLTCCGDVDLAITAAVLDPRPAWVTLHIGKRVPVEMTNMVR